MLFGLGAECASGLTLQRAATGDYDGRMRYASGVDCERGHWTDRLALGIDSERYRTALDV